jgi:hypothetical protein
MLNLDQIDASIGGKFVQTVVNVNVDGGDPNAIVDALRTYMRQNGSIPITVSNAY